MDTYRKAVENHYTAADDLLAVIERASRRAGREFQTLTREDIAALDEFHIRGRAATREMAQLAGVKSGMRVLDLGCGIGGPARTLAAEYGCTVVGVDLLAEYCRAATALSAQVGLQEQVTFLQGDITALPLPDRGFDLLWIQHVTMNIPNKQRLATEAKRLLCPGGRLALFEVYAGELSPPHFPVPWAGDASISFLTSYPEMQALLLEQGFYEIARQDQTALSRDWFRRVAAAIQSRPTPPQSALSVNLLMGETAPEKARNMARNLAEDRIRVIQSVWEIELS